MHPIRSLVILAAALVLPSAPALAAAPDADWAARFADQHDGPEQTAPWTKTFRVGAGGSLDISNVAGTIIVTGGTGDEIRIDGVKRARARDAAAARRLLDDLVIDATEQAGRVEVRTTYPRSRDRAAEVDFTVQVPAGVAVVARSVSGDVTVNKVKGEVHVESVSGTVSAANDSLVTRIKSVSGDVTVTECAAMEGLSAGSVSGNVTLRRLKAKGVDLQTVSGDLVLQELVSERAQVKTVSGDVQYSGPLLKGGRYELTSHSGDLHVMVSQTSGFELNANTFSGDIQSDLKLTMTGGTKNDDDGIPGLPKNHEVRGTYGDGGALVVAKTFSGDVRISKGDAK